jgi:DNA-binding MarR family transcriptional regulator
MKARERTPETKTTHQAEHDDTLSLMAIVVSRMNDFIMQRLRERDVTGIVPSHGGILNALYTSGSATKGELAQRIARNPSTVTVLVRKLEKLGYVSVAPDTQDARVSVVTLTPLGRSFEPTFSAASREWKSVVASTLDEDEQEQLHDMLERMREAFD